MAVKGALTRIDVREADSVPSATRRPRHDLNWFWDELASCEGDTERLLALITRRVTELVGEAGVLTVVDDDQVTLRPVAFHHPDPDVLEAMRGVLTTSPYRVGEGAIGTVAADRQPVILSNIDQQVVGPLLAEGTLPFLEKHPIRSMMVVPLVAFGEVLGTLGVMRVHADVPYDDTDLLVLESLAERAALSLGAATRRPRPIDPADYEAIFHHSLDGVLFTVPDGRILAANPAACSILQRSEAQICRLGRSGILKEDDLRVRQGIEKRSINGSVRSEVPMVRGDGRVFTADLASTTFVTKDNELRACVIFRDVSEQVALRERLERQTRELERLADHDPLSNLFNRRGFVAAAERALSFAEREGVPVQLAFIDLDDLKAINDRYGHPTGDTVLRRLSASIRDCIRAVDVAARLSGDEFAILLYGATTEDVRTILDRITRSFGDAGDRGPAATFSAGTAERAADSALTLDDLIEQADKQMYLRKTMRRIERHRSNPR